MSENNDWRIKPVGELIGAYNAGVINERNIGTLSCYHLVALLELMRQRPGGKDFYLKIKNYLEEINIQRLKKQDKIVIGFIANYSATWIGDELYRLFEKNGRFEPYVFLIANFNAPNIDLVKEEYAKNLEFFKEHNLRVVQTLDLDTGRQYTWEELGIKPQICIWLTPWTDLFREHFHLLNYSLDILHTNIPYAICMVENKYHTFTDQAYNQFIHNVTWKNFEESNYAMSLAEQYAFVGNSNAVYTGYPKMDAFFDEKPEDILWKKIVEKSGIRAPKRIIYAPHHTIEPEDTICFSNFASNYMLMLEYAEKYQDETVWVFRPHPHLKYKAVKAGIFKNAEEWKAYLNRWKALKNAEVIEEGTYAELFMHSDAMILDSCSFTVEYLYVHKPLLFLTREEQRFNEFGSELLKCHYCAAGSDSKQIELFIQDVVIKGLDGMREKRELFFDRYLNYTRKNGKNASEEIFEIIRKQFEK